MMHAQHSGWAGPRGARTRGMHDVCEGQGAVPSVLVLVQFPEDAPDDIKVVVREIVPREVDVGLLVELEEHLH